MAAKNAGTVEYLNPEGLHRSPAYSQAVVVSGPVKTIYIGGQNAVNAAGEVVGKGDFQAQTRQILTNIQACLAAADAGFEHIIKWTILVVPGQSFQQGFATFQEFVGENVRPATITAAVVAGLAHPDYLAEIDAIAVVPD